MAVAFREPVLHQHAKLRQYLSNGCGDMATVRFSKWRPSAILDFEIHS